MHFINIMIQNRSVNANDSHHMVAEVRRRELFLPRSIVQGEEALKIHIPR